MKDTHMKKTRRLRAFSRSDSGQSILEVAIVAPVLVLLLAGTYDVGRYMYDGIEIANAARAGVQYGAQNLVAANQYGGIIAAVTSDAPEMKLQTTAPSDVSSGPQAIPSTDPPTSFLVCACDSTPATLGPCTGGSAVTCGANDRVDTFVQVVVSHTFTPTFSLPGLPSSLTITRTAIQELNQSS